MFCCCCCWWYNQTPAFKIKKKASLIPRVDFNKLCTYWRTQPKLNYESNLRCLCIWVVQGNAYPGVVQLETLQQISFVLTTSSFYRFFLTTSKLKERLRQSRWVLIASLVLVYEQVKFFPELVAYTGLCGALSLTWRAAMQIYWDKRKTKFV